MSTQILTSLQSPIPNLLLCLQALYVHIGIPNNFLFAHCSLFPRLNFDQNELPVRLERTYLSTAKSLLRSSQSSLFILFILDWNYAAAEATGDG